MLLAVRDDNAVQGDSVARPQDAGKLLTLAHPQLEANGDPFWLPESVETEFLGSICHGDFRDPAASSSPAYTGLWHACWAPVRGTEGEAEFYVVYQQRAQGIPAGLWISVLFALAAVLIALSMQHLRRAATSRG